MVTLERVKELSKELYDKLLVLWQNTGISNPARKDSFEAVQFSLQHTGTIIIASDDEELLGAVWVNHDYRRLYIHHMAVNPQKQNQGIGTMLMVESVKIAGEYGYQAKLEVHVDNYAAWHLYEKFGFTELSGYRTLILRDK